MSEKNKSLLINENEHACQERKNERKISYNGYTATINNHNIMGKKVKVSHSLHAVGAVGVGVPLYLWNS